VNETATRFQERASRFTAIVDGAAPQWDAATPCEGWAVRDVVAHAVETERDFLAKQGFDLPAPAGNDPAATWRAHAAAVVEILGRDGVPERHYDGYFGQTTVADTMADFYGWDLVVHGWDVARATGQPWSIDDEEAAQLSATADDWGDALHSEGVCGPELTVPDDASAQDRLLARLGRDPRWRPAGGPDPR
jgi:uncharacterized protein (TIGR03086 family)